MDLIGEWLEEEMLNALSVVPSSTPPGPPVRNAAETETVSAKAFEQ